MIVLHIPIGRAEWGIGRYEHVAILTKLDQTRLVQVRVAFNLVANGLDDAMVEDSLQLFAVEIGNADRLGQARFDAALESPPRVEVVNIGVNEFAFIILGE